jgi:hypothetical protein
LVTRRRQAGALDKGKNSFRAFLAPILLSSNFRSSSEPYLGDRARQNDEIRRARRAHGRGRSERTPGGTSRPALPCALVA